MRKALSDVARYIKSANAGATMLTIDIGFSDHATYNAVLASGAFEPEKIAALYCLDPSVVSIYRYDPANTIKISLPRPEFSAGLGETDFDGVQQYIPLLEFEIELGDAPILNGD